MNVVENGPAFPNISREPTPRLRYPPFGQKDWKIVSALCCLSGELYGRKTMCACSETQPWNTTIHPKVGVWIGKRVSSQRYKGFLCECTWRFHFRIWWWKRTLAGYSKWNIFSNQGHQELYGELEGKFPSPVERPYKSPEIFQEGE